MGDTKNNQHVSGLAQRAGSDFEKTGHEEFKRVGRTDRLPGAFGLYEKKCLKCVRWVSLRSTHPTMPYYV